jgi:hypothetical protein
VVVGNQVGRRQYQSVYKSKKCNLAVAADVKQTDYVSNMIDSGCISSQVDFEVWL